MLQSYSNILVPVGYGEEAKAILKKAKIFQETYQSHITLMHVIEEHLLFPSYGFLAPYMPQFNFKDMEKKSEDFIDQAAKEIGLSNYDKYICYGYPETKILETAKEKNKDLILLGSHHRNALDLLLGSTASAVLQKSECDVYVVKNHDVVSNINKILVCVDFMPDIEPVVLRAKDLADKCEAELSLIHVTNRVPIYEAPINTFEKEVIDKIKWQLKQLVETYKLGTPKSELVVGVPKYEIINHADENNIDLIVLGSHGKHGVQLLLGSVANGVLNRARCDVLATRVNT